MIKHSIHLIENQPSAQPAIKVEGSLSKATAIYCGMLVCISAKVKKF